MPPSTANEIQSRCRSILEERRKIEGEICQLEEEIVAIHAVPGFQEYLDLKKKLAAQLTTSDSSPDFSATPRKSKGPPGFVKKGQEGIERRKQEIKEKKRLLGGIKESEALIRLEAIDQGAELPVAGKATKEDPVTVGFIPEKKDSGTPRNQEKEQPSESAKITYRDIEKLLDAGDREGAVKCWQELRKSDGKPHTRKALYHKARVDSSDFAKWLKGDKFRDGSPTDKRLIENLTTDWDD